MFVLFCVYTHFIQPVALESLTGYHAIAVKAPKSSVLLGMSSTHFTFAVGSTSPLYHIDGKKTSFISKSVSSARGVVNIEIPCATTAGQAQCLLGKNSTAIS